MVYFVVVFIATVMGLLSFRAWLLYRSRASYTIHDAIEKAAHYIALQDWNGAENILSPLISSNEGGTRATLLYIQLLRGMRQHEKALDICNNARNHEPLDRSFSQEHARILMDLGRHEEALKSLMTHATPLHNDDDVLNLASALLYNSNIFDAWKILKKHVANSHNGRLLALAGDCHFSWRDYEKALTLYLRSRECGWSNHQILYRIGFCYKSLGKLSEAEQHFSEIVSHDENDVDAILGLGECFAAQGFFEKALILYQTVAAWNEGDANILHQAGICAIMMQQYNQGRLYLQAALAKGVHSPQLLAFLGYSLEYQRLWKEAEEVYLKLTDLYPRHVSGYIALAWMYGVGYSVTISSEDGLSMAHQAVLLNPDPLSWEILSACEARAGNFSKAHHIQECLSSQPADKDTRRRRQQAMRMLRKKLPLTEEQVGKILVA